MGLGQIIRKYKYSSESAQSALLSNGKSVWTMPRLRLPIRSVGKERGVVARREKLRERYKLCYYRFGELTTEYGKPPGYDRARGVEIQNKDIKLEHLEEAFTTSNWIVRIYKVKPPNNRILMQLTAKFSWILIT